ncbi:MAG: hypothetical protein HOW73_43390 [Polyangiaceae bacterium]|nr:hypothetical protein [Polyangiaceae bacterium]
MQLSTIFVVVDPSPSAEELSDVLLPMTLSGFAEWAAGHVGKRGVSEEYRRAAMYTNAHEARLDAVDRMRNRARDRAVA